MLGMAWVCCVRDGVSWVPFDLAYLSLNTDVISETVRQEQAEPLAIAGFWGIMGSMFVGIPNILTLGSVTKGEELLAR